MPQTILPFKLEEDDRDTKITSFAGMPLFYELFLKMELKKIISKYLRIKEKGCTEHEMTEVILGIIIAGGKEDLSNARIDHHLGAYHAWFIRAIQGRPLNRDPMIGRLNDRVLFGVKAPTQFMTRSGWYGFVLAQASHLIAMLETRRSTVVARGQDPFLFDQQSPHFPADTSRPHCDHFSNRHKVFRP